MSDDLVERLYDRRVCSPAQNSCRNDWVPDQAAARIEELIAENERLTGVVAQCRGMADQGIDAPNAAYRWCERIDEVCAAGKPIDEYEQWAWQHGGKPTQPEGSE